MYSTEDPMIHISNLLHEEQKVMHLEFQELALSAQQRKLTQDEVSKLLYLERKIGFSALSLGVIWGLEKGAKLFQG